MAKFGTYDAVGNRECLLDVITNITPSETPMFSRFGKVQVDGIYPNWQTDTLRNPTDNKQIQSYTYASVMGTVTPTVLAHNYTQILACGYEVTDTQNVVAKAGRTDELAYQKAKAMKEFALDCEYSILNHATEVAPAAAVPAEMNGLIGFITTNDPDNAGNALTENILLAAMETAWDGGATEMNAIYTGARQKKVINDFGSTARTMNQSEETYKNLVSVYESDFGTVEILLDRRIAKGAGTADLFCLTDNMWKVGVLQPVVTKPVPKDGAYERFVIEGQLTVISYQEKASLRIKNLL
jgi:hypothetical protein